MDEALHVVFVAHGEAGVDCGGGGAPVFVEFEAAGASFALLAKGNGGGVVAFSCDAEIEGEGIDRL